MNINGTHMEDREALELIRDSGAEFVYMPDDCPGYGCGEDPFCFTLERAQELALECEADYSTEITVSEYSIDQDPESIEPLTFTGRWWTWTGSGWSEQ